MPAKPHLKLGDLLIKEELITESQLREGISLQKRSAKRLGEALVDLGYVSERQLAQVLGRQLGLPFRSLANGDLTPADDPAVRKALPVELIHKHSVLPLFRQRNTLTVALADPLDLILVDNLKKIAGLQISPVIATPTDLRKAIEAAYGRPELLKKAVEGTYKESPKRGESPEAMEMLGTPEIMESPEELTAKAGEAQVIRLVDLFLLEAVNSRASDIHIEPYPQRMSIRLRIDGVLHPVDPPAPHLMPAIISRIKIMAKMDIAEKRLPQDGGFTVRLGDRTIDLRVSTIPVIYGEKVVIRLLDKGTLIFDFKEIGMEGRGLEDFERVLGSPHGLIFLTGPTGSGKSTTLYAAMNFLKNPGKNIVSIEDPVEYKIDGVNQVQAKPQIGLTFATGLRAFLRQDPDIIMVGEVRDLETAEICVRAALTGHLVLSTLHTNDAASAVTRLVDLGIEPFLLSPSLVLIIAQRLVRKLCRECKEPAKPAATFQERIKLPEGTYFRAKGCASCRSIGYRGRVGIFEVLRVDEDLQDLIGRGATAKEIKNLARSKGMKTLFENGVDKAVAGLTSLEEVFSVTLSES